MEHIQGKRGQLKIQTFKTPSFSTVSTLVLFKVDVIVNSTTYKLELRLGRGSKALLTAAGAGLQTECNEKYPTGIQKGEVAVTGPGNLRCKFIFHGCLNRYGSQDAEKVKNLAI